MSTNVAIQRISAERRTSLQLIYVLSASLFVAAAAVGFGPRVVNGVPGGFVAPLWLVVVHGAAMTAWLGLFVAQTLLVAAGRRGWHRRLGVAAFALGPAILILTMAVNVWQCSRLVAAGQVAGAAGLLFSGSLIGVQFAVFFTWAVLARNRAAEMHKRMMVMTTLVLMSAASSRMAWLPWPANPAAGTLMALGTPLVLIIPALFDDVLRLGRVHRAYVIGLGLHVPCIVASALFSSAAWWQRATAVLFGAG